MNHDDFLIMMQFGCMLVTGMLALFLAVSRLYYCSSNKDYEMSRWLLCVCMFMLSVHYLLQMVCGFRAQGDDIGALVNILFYSPVVYIIAYVNTRMATGTLIIRHTILISSISYILILLCLGVGYLVNSSFQMADFLYAMGIIFFISITSLFFYNIRSIQSIQQRVENETSDDNTIYKLHMKTGVYLLYILAILVPLAIFSIKTLALLAPFILFALVVYIVGFVTVGFVFSPLNDVIEGISPEEVEMPSINLMDEEKVNDDRPRLTSEQINQIETAIAEWRNNNGFSSMNLTSTILSRRLDIPKKLLIQYLSEHKGETFRVWLSNIRIEEVKRLLLDREDFNNETIAQECGFSSRSWMQEKFKASTGMTPAEWREAQRHNKWH